MSKNPIINALGASAYIVLVVGVMTFTTSPLRNKPDTFLAPVTALSVLTLSVAVMAYLFLPASSDVYRREEKGSIKLVCQNRRYFCYFYFCSFDPSFFRALNRLFTRTITVQKVTVVTCVNNNLVVSSAN